MKPTPHTHLTLYDPRLICARSIASTMEQQCGTVQCAHEYVIDWAKEQQVELTRDLTISELRYVLTVMLYDMETAIEVGEESASTEECIDLIEQTQRIARIFDKAGIAPEHPEGLTPSLCLPDCKQRQEAAC